MREPVREHALELDQVELLDERGGDDHCRAAPRGDHREVDPVVVEHEQRRVRDAQSGTEPLDQVLDARLGAVRDTVRAEQSLDVRRRAEDARGDDEPTEHNARGHDHKAETQRSRDGEPREAHRADGHDEDEREQRDEERDTPVRGSLLVRHVVLRGQGRGVGTTRGGHVAQATAGPLDRRCAHRCARSKRSAARW